VAPHKQALLDLYKGWKSPESEITAMTVLANIETLAETNDLFHLFDWLDVRFCYGFFVFPPYLSH